MLCTRSVHRIMVLWPNEFYGLMEKSQGIESGFGSGADRDLVSETGSIEKTGL